MAIKFQSPKGTEDYYPEQRNTQKRIFDAMTKVAVKYGFREVEPPVIENLRLLEAKQGEEIKSQIFVLEKKGEEHLALRSEFTPSLARMFVEKQKILPKPVKWFCANRVWRYERPQAGRMREFFQFNVECFGSDKPEADAEVLCVMIDMLKSVGLSDKDFTVFVNNRKLLEELLYEIIAKDKIPEVFHIIDKNDKITKEEFEKELSDLKIEKEKAKKIEKLIQIEDVDEIEAKSDAAKEALDNIKKIFSLLGEKKKCVKLNLGIVRGLAYYTGTVFEAFDTKRKFRALGGGGRYDQLIELYGGEPTAATGFGIGYSTLTLLLQEKKILPEPVFYADYFIATVTDELRPKAFEIAEKLRKEGIVEIDIMGRKLAKQLQYANNIKARNVIILGPDEMKEGKAIIKEMETGKEEKVDLHLIE